MTNEVLLKTFKQNLEDRLGRKLPALQVLSLCNHCNQAGLLSSLLEQDGFEDLLKVVFPELIARLLLEEKFIVFFEQAFPKMLEAFFLEREQ